MAFCRQCGMTLRPDGWCTVCRRYKPPKRDYTVPAFGQWGYPPTIKWAEKQEVRDVVLP
jgi:hypothetical protein